MEGIKGFIKGVASMAMATILIIALVGAILSTDMFFKVAGVLGLGIWAVIAFRSLKHHDVSGKNHNNWL